MSRIRESFEGWGPKMVAGTGSSSHLLPRPDGNYSRNTGRSTGAGSWRAAPPPPSQCLCLYHQAPQGTAPVPGPCPRTNFFLGGPPTAFQASTPSTSFPTGYSKQLGHGALLAGFTERWDFNRWVGRDVSKIADKRHGPAHVTSVHAQN